MKMKRQKTDADERISLVVKMIIALLAVIVVLAIGYERGKNSREETPATVVLPMPTVAINLCYPPFNAIPNDSISDAAAFELASEIIRNIKMENGDTPIDIALTMPVGHYIINESIDFKDTKVRIKVPSIIGLYGNDITLSGNSFIMLGED